MLYLVTDMKSVLWMISFVFCLNSVDAKSLWFKFQKKRSEKNVFRLDVTLTGTNNFHKHHSFNFDVDKIHYIRSSDMNQRRWLRLNKLLF